MNFKLFFFFMQYLNFNMNFNNNYKILFRDYVFIIQKTFYCPTEFFLLEILNK